MPTESKPRRSRGDDDGLVIVGLIGSAGSGKTTVARALEARGAVTISADAIGHAVTDTDPDVRAALIQDYGEDVYRPDGALDRATVAARVFRDPAARARLNALVHPRIAARIDGQLAALRARGFRGTVVIDAALLLDWGMERECDVIVAVLADEDEQVRRLQRDRGWAPDEARRRLAAQRPNDAFAAAADLVLWNRADADTLAREAVRALDALARERRLPGC